MKNKTSILLVNNMICRQTGYHIYVLLIYTRIWLGECQTDEDYELKDALTSTPSPPSPYGKSVNAYGAELAYKRRFPKGFKVVDGVLMDVTNVLVQHATTNNTYYTTYHRKTGRGVVYRRPKKEAGWHFVLFEDPEEMGGTGHYVLLQKKHGFKHRMMKNSLSVERLYEAFHLDLGYELGGKNRRDFNILSNGAFPSRKVQSMKFAKDKILETFDDTVQNEKLLNKP